MEVFANINCYTANLSTEIQIILQKMCLTIQQVVPEVKEAIKYGMPIFVLKGNLVHFAAYKKHIGFFPASSGIDAFTDKLAVFGTGKGTIQSSIDKAITYDRFIKVVKFRVVENLGKTGKKSKGVR